MPDTAAPLFADHVGRAVADRGRRRGSNHRRRGADGENGAIAAEHVAALVLVAALIAAVYAVSVHTTVGEWAAYASCQLFTTDEDACERPTSDEPVLAQDDGPSAGTDREPPVCTMTSNRHDRRRSTDWIFSRSVEGERYTSTQLSDGSVVILDTSYEGSGTSAGGGIDVTDKLGISLSGSSVELEETGRMFVLSPEALDAYQETMDAIIVDAYVNGPQYLNRLLGGDASTPAEYVRNLETLQLRQVVIDALIDDHATHDYVRTSQEVSVSLGASYKVGSGRLTIGGSAGTVIAEDRETGDYTVSYELDAETALQLGVGVFGVGAGIEGTGAADASVTLEFSADDELLGASVTTGLEVGGGGYIGIDPGSLPGEAVDGLETSGGPGVSLNGAGRVESTFSLPLAGDEDAVGQIAAFVEDPVGNMGQLIDVAGRQGEVLVQGYEVTEGSDGLDLAIRLIAQAAFSDERTHQHLMTVDAVSYDPVHGLQRRPDCVG